MGVGLRLSRPNVVLRSGKHSNCKIMKNIFIPEGEQRVEIQDIFEVRQFARRVLGQWNVRGCDGLNM